MNKVLVVTVGVAVGLFGCGGTGAGGGAGGGSGGGAGGGSGGGSSAEAQNPPTSGRAAVEAWLAKGFYKSWACEPLAHAPRSPSPHGPNRICSNAKLSAHAEDGGEYPVDSASVKELYSADAGAIEGIAVARHVTAGTSGSTWYWYERVPLTSGAPHDDAGVVADGLGSSGPAKDICVGCHQGAGSDAQHSRSRLRLHPSEVTVGQSAGV